MTEDAPEDGSRPRRFQTSRLGIAQRWRSLEAVVGNPVVFWVYCCGGYIAAVGVLSLLFAEPRRLLVIQAAAAPLSATVMVTTVSWRILRSRR